jgi:hypothetical protein
MRRRFVGVMTSAGIGLSNGVRREFKHGSAHLWLWRFLTQPRRH